MIRESTADAQRGLMQSPERDTLGTRPTNFDFVLSPPPPNFATATRVSVKGPRSPPSRGPRGHMPATDRARGTPKPHATRRHSATMAASTRDRGRQAPYSTPAPGARSRRRVVTPCDLGPSASVANPKPKPKPNPNQERKERLNGPAQRRSKCSRCRHPLA